MPFAVAIKFRLDSFSKLYDPQDQDASVDDFFVVRNVELGVDRVGFVSSLEGRATVQMRHLPKIIRRASDEEIERWYETNRRDREMIETVRQRALAHGLSIKVSDVNTIEEKRQVLVHFTADGRIDFRELVKDLAARFRARIEMWQIGVRMESASKDGIGICGNKFCCSCWMKDFPSISLRHAKDQDIIQPPSKLSGPCGRLRCCLRYEHETYVGLAMGAPELGCSGCGSSGECGVVQDRNLLKQEATLRAHGGATSVVAFEDFRPDTNN